MLCRRVSAEACSSSDNGCGGIVVGVGDGVVGGVGGGGGG